MGNQCVVYDEAWLLVFVQFLSNLGQLFCWNLSFNFKLCNVRMQIYRYDFDDKLL